MFKHKAIYYPVILVILLAVYLYTANAFIYYRIGQGGLAFPHRQTYYSMPNNNNSVSMNYVALGDSLTSGIGADRYEESYPYLLAKKMSEAGLNINSRNFSAPGAQTRDLIYNFLNPAIASKPDIVTVLIGVNDIHNHISESQFKKNYKYILDKLSKETKAKIYLINIPYIGSDTMILPPLNYYFDSETNKYNIIIKELADEYGVNYIDLNSPVKDLFKIDGNHYSVDSFHPSAYGYKLWANVIYDCFNK